MHVSGAASAYTRLTGLKPRLGLPSLPATQSELDEGKIQEKINAYRDKVSNKTKRSTHQKFQIGDKVSIFNAGTKQFDQKGTIFSFVPNENSLPTSYHVKMPNGNIRVINQSWLHPQVPS